MATNYTCDFCGKTMSTPKVEGFLVPNINVPIGFRNDMPTHLIISARLVLGQQEIPAALDVCQKCIQKMLRHALWEDKQ